KNAEHFSGGGDRANIPPPALSEVESACLPARGRRGIWESMRPFWRNAMHEAGSFFRAAVLFVLALTFAASADAAQNAAPPRAPEPQVDVNLVLAVDASGSVSQDRFELQKQGYAAAFRNPKVLAAIRQGNYQSI